MEGILNLEESAAERVIQDFIIPQLLPKVVIRLKNVAASGVIFAWHLVGGVVGDDRNFAASGATRELASGESMIDFYSRLHEDNNPSQALAEVQRDALVKLRAKFGLLPAVVMAGAFIVSSQGPVR